MAKVFSTKILKPKRPLGRSSAAHVGIDFGQPFFAVQVLCEKFHEHLIGKNCGTSAGAVRLKKIF
jgi:hypothetical protein